MGVLFMKRLFTLFIFLLISCNFLYSKDIWYKTDFPESEQIKEFSTFGIFILTEAGNIYINDNLLHWELIYEASNDTIPNSIFGDTYEAIYGDWEHYYEKYNIFVGTNKGVFKLANKKLTALPLPGISSQPTEVLGEHSNSRSLYFRLSGKGLYAINLESKKIDTIHYFDTISYRNLRTHVSGLKLLANNNEIYSVGGNSDSASYVYKSISEYSGINDVINDWGDYTATSNGLFSYEGAIPNLEGKNCLEIAVDDFVIIDGIYDPNRIDSNMYYTTAFIATEKNGVYWCDYSPAYPINGGLEDTNMTHIALRQDFKLVASTKSKGVYKTANIMVTGVINEPYATASISPNPTQSIFKININNSQIISSCQIYDIYGNIVLESTTAPAYDLSFDLSALPAGTYYCKALVGGKLIVKKIMKV